MRSALICGLSLCSLVLLGLAHEATTASPEAAHTHDDHTHSHDHTHDHIHPEENIHV
jgi:hypothetical protein